MHGNHKEIATRTHKQTNKKNKKGKKKHIQTEPTSNYMLELEGRRSLKQFF